MDLSLVQSNVYELPTSRRVGVIVHDGTTDLRLWPGPGPDKELLTAYGPELTRQLEAERTRAGGTVPIGTVIRLIPGRLHCDFLLWVATRGPEERGEQALAPQREVIEAAVEGALEYVRERNVVRVAFPALGAGPGEMDDAERLAVIARACTKHSEGNLAASRATTIEEIVLADPRLSAVTAARRLVGQIAKLAVDTQARGSSPPPAKKRKAPAKRGAAAAKRGQPKLDPGEIARARTVAHPWDRSVRYRENELFIHSKFGVGKVVGITMDDFIVCLFEDGETRKLIHAKT